MSLFYVKFQNLGLLLKPLIQELESRCPDHPEYFSLLKDCTSTFFDVRKTILTPYMMRHIQSISSQNILNFSKMGCAYTLSLSADEHKLYRDFFDLSEDELM